MTVDSWVDVDALHETENSEDSILESGFKFSGSGNGMNFPVGKVEIHKFSENGGIKQKNGKIVKRLMLCKVAIGRAYNAADDFAKIAAIPDGYDSFVVESKKENGPKKTSRASKESISENNETVNESEISRDSYDFIVKDSNQILPTFVVVFEFDPDAEKRSRQKVTCENCERRVATVFCQSDAANLCDQCDSEMHSSKLAARHVRVPLEASGAQTFSSCRIHPDKIVEFFCPSCSRPVCVHCKMVGHHSTGDAARHKLITIAEAFKSVAESANAIDPILESRKAAINAQQSSVEERAKQIIANATTIQTQLDEIYARAQTDLKALLKKKLNVLRGDSVELGREMSEIAQLEAFLEYQKSGPNATQFILDWSHHQRLRSELHSFPFFRETIDVLPDIRVNGGLQVHVESALNGNGSNFGYSTAEMSVDKRFSIGASPNSPGRARATPTIDLSAYKVRKATDYVADIPLSYAASSNQLAPNTTTNTYNNSPQYAPSSDERKSSAK